MSVEQQWCEITSNCLCEDYDEQTDTSKPSEHCFGYCWKEQVEMFTEATKNFFDGYRHDYVINNYPTWQGGRSGIIPANTAKEFLYALVGRIGDWRGTYTMDGDELLFTIYHHDAPTGGTMRIEKQPWSE
jgi:hypothetical protein